MCFPEGFADVFEIPIGFAVEGDEAVGPLYPSTQKNSSGVYVQDEIQHERRLDQIGVRPERIAEVCYVQRDGEVDEEGRIVNLEW